MPILHPIPGTIPAAAPERRPFTTRLVVSGLLLAATATAATMGFGGDALPAVWLAYAGYFAVRWVEHLLRPTRFWLSTLAFGLAVAVVALDAWLGSNWIRLAVALWVLVLAWLAGVGRRVHASTVALSFYLPVHLLSFTPGVSPILVGLAVTLSTVFVVVAAFRNRYEREIAAKHGGRAMLDSGAIAVRRDRGELWLPPRVELVARRGATSKPPSSRSAQPAKPTWCSSRRARHRARKARARRSDPRRVPLTLAESPLRFTDRNGRSG